MERALQVAAFVMAIFLTVSVSVCIAFSVLASGRVEYCYFETTNNNGIRLYQLKGWRNWRIDNDMGYYISLEEATTAARSINCPLTTEK